MNGIMLLLLLHAFMEWPRTPLPTLLLLLLLFSIIFTSHISFYYCCSSQHNLIYEYVLHRIKLALTVKKL